MTVEQLRALLRDYPGHYLVGVHGKRADAVEPQLREVEVGPRLKLVLIERKDRG